MGLVDRRAVLRDLKRELIRRNFRVVLALGRLDVDLGAVLLGKNRAPRLAVIFGAERAVLVGRSVQIVAELERVVLAGFALHELHRNELRGKLVFLREVRKLHNERLFKSRRDAQLEIQDLAGRLVCIIRPRASGRSDQALDVHFHAVLIFSRPTDVPGFLRVRRKQRDFAFLAPRSPVRRPRSQAGRKRGILRHLDLDRRKHRRFLLDGDRDGDARGRLRTDRDCHLRSQGSGIAGSEELRRRLVDSERDPCAIRFCRPRNGIVFNRFLVQLDIVQCIRRRLAAPIRSAVLRRDGRANLHRVRFLRIERSVCIRHIERRFVSGFNIVVNRRSRKFSLALYQLKWFAHEQLVQVKSGRAIKEVIIVCAKLIRARLDAEISVAVQRILDRGRDNALRVHASLGLSA